MRMGETGVADMLPVPPDGGYGWVIVFAAFMSNFVVDGISNSFGAFMTVYQKHFGESKAVVSLIGSLLIGSYLLIGVNCFYFIKLFFMLLSFIFINYVNGIFYAFILNSHIIWVEPVKVIILNMWQVQSSLLRSFSLSHYTLFRQRISRHTVKNFTKTALNIYLFDWNIEV